MKPKITPKRRTIIREPAIKTKSRYTHLIMGYVFLALVFLGAVSSVYYWEYKAKVRAAHEQSGVKHVESGEQVPEVNGAACESTPVTARQKQTGELREFPTPCHVSEEWWEIVK